jgi:hypothetical protein
MLAAVRGRHWASMGPVQVLGQDASWDGWSWCSLCGKCVLYLRACCGASEWAHWCGGLRCLVRRRCVASVEGGGESRVSRAGGLRGHSGRLEKAM